MCRILVIASAVIGSVAQLIVARDELNERWQFDFGSLCTSINFYHLNRLTHVYPPWDKPYTDRCEPSIMPLLTTVIGSFPKPHYLNIPDWFNPKSMKDFAAKHTRFLQDETAPEREELISRAIKETVQLQWEAGLDVITDGEMRRENYINHFCRKLKGFDFHTLFSKEIRGGGAAGRLLGLIFAGYVLA